MFPREFKNQDNTQMGTDNQSVQSVAGNVSCNIIIIIFLYYYNRLL